ncbi:MAG: hypothetical protein IT176_13270 [Acidobacteria bacterium]|nr:hypothetical protein [Acidobacteriota bacterium]
MTTVLWISAVGGTLLFFALALLVGFMYLLTAPWLFPIEGEGEPPMRPGKKRRFRRRKRSIEPVAAAPLASLPAPSETDAIEAEQERRRRAVALAVAASCAEEGQTFAVPADSSIGWRQMHRARRLARVPARQRARL